LIGDAPFNLLGHVVSSKCAWAHHGAQAHSASRQAGSIAASQEHAWAHGSQPAAPQEL